jgi:hypothetical protein
MGGAGTDEVGTAGDSNPAAATCAAGLGSSNLVGETGLACFGSKASLVGAAVSNDASPGGWPKPVGPGPYSSLSIRRATGGNASTGIATTNPSKNTARKDKNRMGTRDWKWSSERQRAANDSPPPPTVKAEFHSR